MRTMKMLWGVAAAVVLSVGCNAAPMEDESEFLVTPDTVSAMGGEGGGGECPPPRCPKRCGHDGKKFRLCHHAPPDDPHSKSIELCLPKPAFLAHLEQHDEDEPGCCPKH